MAGSPKIAAPVHAARHAARATTPSWRLLTRFVLGLKMECLITAPSTLAWMVLRRKYDAFTTDFAYGERPSSWLGQLGWWSDRRVRNYPLHVALRERLAIVSRTIAAAVEERARANQGGVRVLSAPCGLCRDVLTAGASLRERLPALTSDIQWHGLDIDARGDVLPEARRRAAAVGQRMTFFREDLFDPAGLTARVERDGAYDVVNCIGLTIWLTLGEVERLVGFFRDVTMRPGSRLIIDNWAEHAHSHTAADLEIAAFYHDPAAFQAVLRRRGFQVTRVTTTTNGACTVIEAVAR